MVVDCNTGRERERATERGLYLEVGKNNRSSPTTDLQNDDVPSLQATLNQKYPQQTESYSAFKDCPVRRECASPTR